MLFVSATLISCAGAWADEESASLAEVVVTAQKRAERQQDVPISVQVVTAEMRVEDNINSLSTLAQTTPGVFVTTAGRSNQQNIRGIGSGVSQVFDQSVGTYIDDVYHGRTHAAGATFLDLDSVEILKGPQSTYFGNNSIAGAFNIVTKKPGDTFSADARAGYSPEANQYVLEAAAGGPVSDTFGVRVAVTSNGQEGWVRNVNTGGREPQYDNQAGRVTFSYKPIDDLDATLKVEASRNNDRTGFYLNITHCPPAPPFVTAGICAAVLATGKYSPDTTMDIDGPYNYTGTRDAALTVNYRKWNHTFTSVTGFYGYNYESHSAFDGIPVASITANLPETYHQISQEFRVASPTGQPLEYLGGVYFQSSRLRYTAATNYIFLTPILAGSPFAPYAPLAPEIKFLQDEEDYSAFGSLSWNATDSLKLTAGLRGSSVHKSYEWSQRMTTATTTFAGNVPIPDALQGPSALLGLGVPGDLSGGRTDRALMPSGNIQYRITPDAMVYASYARGFKAGGFNGNDNTAVAANLPFEPEHVNAYEVGLKSEWLNRSVLANLAVFRSDYTNLQLVSDLQTGNGSTFTSFVKNAGAAKTEGVELETQWLVTRDFKLSGNLAYLDAHYVHYPDVPATQEQVLEGQVVQDLSGKPTQFAPRWSGNVAAEYSVSLPAEYRLSTELSAYFTDWYYNSEVGNDDPLHIQPGYYRLDSRVTLESPGGHWAFDAIGKNLNDDRRIVVWASNLPLSPGSMYQAFQEGRNFMFQVRYKY